LMQVAKCHPATDTQKVSPDKNEAHKKWQ